MKHSSSGGGDDNGGGGGGGGSSDKGSSGKGGDSDDSSGGGDDNGGGGSSDKGSSGKGGDSDDSSGGSSDSSNNQPTSDSSNSDNVEQQPPAVVDNIQPIPDDSQAPLAEQTTTPDNTQPCDDGQPRQADGSCPPPLTTEVAPTPIPAPAPPLPPCDDGQPRQADGSCPPPLIASTSEPIPPPCQDNQPRDANGNCPPPIPLTTGPTPSIASAPPTTPSPTYTGPSDLAAPPSPTDPDFCLKSFGRQRFTGEPTPQQCIPPSSSPQNNGPPTDQQNPPQQLAQPSNAGTKPATNTDGPITIFGPQPLRQTGNSGGVDRTATPIDSGTTTSSTNQQQRQTSNQPIPANQPLSQPTDVTTQQEPVSRSAKVGALVVGAVEGFAPFGVGTYIGDKMFGPPSTSPDDDLSKNRNFGRTAGAVAGIFNAVKALSTVAKIAAKGLSVLARSSGSAASMALQPAVSVSKVAIARAAVSTANLPSAGDTATKGIMSMAGKDVENLPRTGSANKVDFVKPIRNAEGKIIKEFPGTPQAHGFNNLVDKFAKFGREFEITGGDGKVVKLIQVEGSQHGVLGRFEWIVDAYGVVTHRMFVKGGVVNGIPTKP